MKTSSAFTVILLTFAIVSCAGESSPVDGPCRVDDPSGECDPDAAIADLADTSAGDPCRVDDPPVECSPDAAVADLADSSAEEPCNAGEFYGECGPYATAADYDVGPGNAYNVYRPEALDSNHPIIAWSNGTVSSVDTYEDTIYSWVSWGFVVIAGHANWTGGGSSIKAGLDWIVDQNSNPESNLYGKLDINAIGASGHSQGGGAVLAAAGEQPGETNISCTVPMMPTVNFGSLHSPISNQQGPMLVLASDSDWLFGYDLLAIQSLTNVDTMMATIVNGSHNDAKRPIVQGLSTAWFRYHLMGDEDAGAYFYGDDCGLCVDGRFTRVWRNWE